MREVGNGYSIPAAIVVLCVCVCIATYVFCFLLLEKHHTPYYLAIATVRLCICVTLHGKYNAHHYYRVVLVA